MVAFIYLKYFQGRVREASPRRDDFILGGLQKSQ
jgi:hypothetical protein